MAKTNTPTQGFIVHEDGSLTPIDAKPMVYRKREPEEAETLRVHMVELMHRMFPEADVRVVEKKD